MQTTIESIHHTTDGGNDNINPPVYTAERNDDGEGDGRRVKAGIETAEAYANGSNVIELSGINLAEAVYGAHQRTILRNRARIPTGRLAVRREVPLFLA
jgi:hypothetical protein